jgi:hypothetical protein
MEKAAQIVTFYTRTLPVPVPVPVNFAPEPVYGYGYPTRGLQYSILHMFSVVKERKRCSNVEDESLYTSNPKDKMFRASFYIFSHVFVKIRSEM